MKHQRNHRQHPRSVTAPHVQGGWRLAEKGASVAAWCTGLTIFCLVLDLTATDPRLMLFLSGVAGVAALTAIFIWIRLLNPTIITPVLFVGFQILPALFFVVSMLMFPETVLGEHPIPFLIEQPFGVFLALVAPSIGFLALVAISKPLQGFSREPFSFQEIGRRLPSHFEWLLIIAALLQFSLWITTDVRFVDSLPAYALRIVSRSVGLVPLLAGYLALRYKIAARSRTPAF